MKAIAEIVIIVLTSLQTFATLEIPLKRNILYTMIPIFLYTFVTWSFLKNHTPDGNTLGKYLTPIKIFLLKNYPQLYRVFKNWPGMSLCNPLNPNGDPSVNTVILTVEKHFKDLQVLRYESCLTDYLKDYKRTSDYKTYKNEKMKGISNLPKEMLKNGIYLKNGKNLKSEVREYLFEKLKNDNSNFYVVKGNEPTNSTPFQCQFRIAKCSNTNWEMKSLPTTQDMMDCYCEYQKLKNHPSTCLKNSLDIFENRVNEKIKSTKNYNKPLILSVFKNGLAYHGECCFFEDDVCVIITSFYKNVKTDVSYNCKVFKNGKKLIETVCDSELPYTILHAQLSLFVKNWRQSITCSFHQGVSHCNPIPEIIQNLLCERVLNVQILKEVKVGFLTAGIKCEQFYSILVKFLNCKKDKINYIIKLLNLYGLDKVDDQMEILVKRLVMSRPKQLKNKHGKLLYSDLNHLYKFLGVQHRYLMTGDYNKTKNLLMIEDLIKIGNSSIGCFSIGTDEEILKIIDKEEISTVEEISQEFPMSGGIVDKEETPMAEEINKGVSMSKENSQGSCSDNPLNEIKEFETGGGKMDEENKKEERKEEKEEKRTERKRGKEKESKERVNKEEINFKDIVMDSIKEFNGNLSKTREVSTNFADIANQIEKLEKVRGIHVPIAVWEERLSNHIDKFGGVEKMPGKERRNYNKTLKSKMEAEESFSKLKKITGIEEDIDPKVVINGLKLKTMQLESDFRKLQAVENNSRVKMFKNILIVSENLKVKNEEPKITVPAKSETQSQPFNFSKLLSKRDCLIKVSKVNNNYLKKFRKKKWRKNDNPVLGVQFWRVVEKCKNKSLFLKYCMAVESKTTQQLFSINSKIEVSKKSQDGQKTIITKEGETFRDFFGLKKSERNRVLKELYSLMELKEPKNKLEGRALETMLKESMKKHSPYSLMSHFMKNLSDEERKNFSPEDIVIIENLVKV